MNRATTQMKYFTSQNCLSWLVKLKEVIIHNTLLTQIRHSRSDRTVVNISKHLQNLIFSWIPYNTVYTASAHNARSYIMKQNHRPLSNQAKATFQPRCHWRAHFRGAKLVWLWCPCNRPGAAEPLILGTYHYNNISVPMWWKIIWIIPVHLEADSILHKTSQCNIAQSFEGTRLVFSFPITAKFVMLLANIATEAPAKFQSDAIISISNLDWNSTQNILPTLSNGTSQNGYDKSCGFGSELDVNP